MPRTPVSFRRPVLWLCVLACLSRCTDEGIGTAAGSVIYGNDDRVDYYETTDETWRRIVRESLVGIIDPAVIDESSPNDIRFVIPTLAQDRGLCSDQRYLDQIVPVLCSGTLIDDDLVLTVGHCAQDLDQCQQWRYVFNFYLTGAGQPQGITDADLFSCKAVVVTKIEEFVDTATDYAVIQLDRKATPRFQPAALQAAAQALPVNAGLTVVGFPSGLPAKIATGGRVLDARGDILDFFFASIDSFEGNSGASVFDDQGRVVGIAARGQLDYVPRGGCFVVNVLPEDGSRGSEEMTYAFRAVEDLCASGWPSQRLCGSGTCGDGVCSPPETTLGCPQDCRDIEPQPDAGLRDGGSPPMADGGTVRRSGGGCQAGPSSGSVPALLLFSLLLVVGRRRRSC